MRNINQDGVFLPMTDELRTMLSDIRRHRQLSGGSAPAGDAQVVKSVLEKAHKDLLEELGYDPKAAARVNDIRNASTAEIAGVSEVDRIAAMAGRAPGWVAAQEVLAGIAPPAGPSASASAAPAEGEYTSRGVCGG